MTYELRAAVRGNRRVPRVALAAGGARGRVSSAQSANLNNPQYAPALFQLLRFFEIAPGQGGSTMALTAQELDRLIYLAYVLRGSDAQTVRLRVMARNTIYANLHAGEFLRILPERLKMLDAREREKKRRDV